MKYIKDINNFIIEGSSAITFGKFDGVHLGHRQLISMIRQRARETGGKAVLFTFDVSPEVMLGHRPRKMLMTNAERKKLLQDMGIEILVECPFTEEIRNLSPEDFVREICLNRLHMKSAVIGDNFRFAKNRTGTPAVLKELGERLGFSVDILPQVQVGGERVSSSRVRELLEEGRMEETAELLGYPYFVTGKIIHGRHLGHSLGFPTINQRPDPSKMLPPSGVYFSLTQIGRRKLQGVTNIGIKPTVEGKELGMETYLFDCDEDLYGRDAKVELLHWSRKEKKFSSIEELKEQMDRDIRDADFYFD